MTHALSINDLHLGVRNGSILTPILRGINLDLSEGEIHGLVGESGAGKTMLGRVILDILPPAAVITSGKVKYPTGASTHSARYNRGNQNRGRISLIPQDPMTSLNPVKRIGKQMGEILKLVHPDSSHRTRKRAEQLLREVKIKKPEHVLQQYPHQLSGGMRQRVLIAMAFSTEPKLIVADEPTTALDVSVQRQVLRLIRALQKNRGTTILFVTHDLGVVAKICDRVSLMHSGMILEQGDVADVFRTPSHRYTQSLLEAIPRYDRPREKLAPVAEDLQTELIQTAREYDQHRQT